MSISRYLGVLLLVVGAVLLGFGINSTQAVSDQMMEGMTGRYTEKTMIYLIAGGLMIAAGTIFSFRRRK